MTPEQTAAIAARNAARTQGKWNQHLVDDTTVVCNGQTICCTFPEGGLDDEVDFNTDTEQREKDAAFIAHASEDIPALLAEVSRLSDALAEAEKRVTEAACDVVDAYSEFDRSYCCDGRMCGCQGQSVHDMMKHFIRAMVRP